MSNISNLFDDLDDFENAPVRESNSKYARTEKFPCDACAGTGFYQGVRIHEEREHCFKCRGKGYFMTSPADREKAKQQRAARKQKQADEKATQFKEMIAARGEDFEAWFNERVEAKDAFFSNIFASGCKYGSLTDRQNAVIERSYQRHLEAMDKSVAFKADNAAVVEWLEANAGQKKSVIEGEYEDNFAASLLKSLNQWGSLSEKQIAAVQRIIDADKNKVVIDLTRIHGLFDSAKTNGAKKPVIRIDGLKLSLAPLSGKNAGCIYVKDNHGEYLGKITEEGKFFGMRSAPADTEKRLVELAKDPRGAMVKFGQITGQCSCCGRELTNKASIELGIGPICAEKFGVL